VIHETIVILAIISQYLAHCFSYGFSIKRVVSNSNLQQQILDKSSTQLKQTRF